MLPLNLNYEPKPPWGFKYGSPQSPLLLEVLSSNRWASTPCAARHWDLINVGEGRRHRGNGDTCHRSNTGLSVTDKYPPRTWISFWSLLQSRGRRRGERLRENTKKKVTCRKNKLRKMTPSFLQSLKVRFEWSNFLTDRTKYAAPNGVPMPLFESQVALKGHLIFSRNFIFKLSLFVMLLFYLMCLFSWKSFLPCCYPFVFLFTYNHPVESTQAEVEIRVIVLAKNKVKTEH